MMKIKYLTKMSLFNLPTPSNISYWWNLGSLLGLFMMIQLISGLLLSFHYSPNTLYAFKCIIHIIQNVNNGWLTHNIHINGASFFFLSMYIHMSRNIYYSSFNLTLPWLSGTMIFMMSMLTAFLGYILPWGQMSFWGATVITNLLSTIPYIGNFMVFWIWGGFSINNATLNRFFSLHFMLPFMIITLIMFHLMSLHMTGSSNPLGINSNVYKIPFHSYFSFKDLLMFMILLMFFSLIILQSPYMFNDSDNFTPANPMLTPTHIQPEWYFLFAYAILRSIPNKLGGVIALFMSIIILILIPLITYKPFFPSNLNPITQTLTWIFFNNFMLLTWTGSQLIEYPYMSLSQFLSLFYFTFLLCIIMSNKLYKYIL